MNIVGRFAATCSWLMLLCFANFSFGQPEEPDLKLQTFRRVYAPKAIIRQLDRLSRNYISMERERFERIVESIERGLPKAIERGVHVKKAVYYAKFDGGQLVDGTADLDFVVDGKNQVEFELGYHGLPLSNVRWNKNGPATLGSSQEQRMILFVPSTDRLQFDWNLQGRAAKQNATEITLNLISARINRVIISTAKNIVLTSSQGVVSYLDEGEFREWTIELGTHRTCTLMMGESEKKFPEMFANQVATYRLQQSGTTVNAIIQVDGQSKRQRQITFELDGSIEPTDVNLNKQPCQWTSAISSSGRKRSLTVQLPMAANAEQQQRSEIQIAGFIPAVFATKIELPTIRTVNARSLQNRILLSIERPLMLRDLEHFGCQPLELSADSNEANQSSYSFQVVDDDAFALKINVDREKFEFDSFVYNDVVASDSELRSTIQARVTALRGSSFQLEMAIQDRWEVESVEVRNEDSGLDLERWDPPVNGTLTISLRQPLVADRTIDLVCRVRRPFNSQTQLTTRDVTPISFRSSRREKQFLSIQTQAPFEIEWTKTRLANWLSATQIESWQSIFDIAGNELVLDLGTHRERLPFKLSPVEPGFRSSLRVRMELSRNSVLEQIQATISPESSVIKEATIRTTSGDDFQWYLVQNQERRPMAYRKTDSSANSSTWKISLSEPRSAEFTLLGESRRAFASEIRVPLASVLGSNSQQAKVEIVYDREVPVTVETPGLVQVIPTEAGTKTKAQQFSYIPENEVGDNSTTSIKIRSESVSSNRRISIWRIEPITSIDHLGICRHKIKAYVENFGNASIHATIPKGFTASKIDVQQQHIDLTKLSDRNIQIPLPAYERYVLIEIEFEASESELGWFDRKITCPEVEFSAPVLQQTWKIWMAPGTSHQEIELDAETTLANRVFRRFFGPFARNRDIGPFNFFSEQSWFRLASTPHVNETRQSIDLLVQMLGEEATSDTDQTWGQVIKKFDAKNRIAKTRNLIAPFLDKRRLALRGIFPTTPFPKIDSSENVLQELDIAVLAAGRRIVITSVDSIGLFSNEMIPTELQRTVLIRSAGEERAISRLLRRRLGPVSNVDDWLRSTIEQKWKDDSSEQELKLLCGWSLTSVNPDQIHRKLRFFNHQFVWRVTGIAFLVAAGLGWWIASRSLSKMILAISFAAAACLLTPSSFATVGAATFWGMISGGCFHWIRRRDHKPRRRTYRDRSHSYYGAIATMIGLMIVFAFSGKTAAQKKIPNYNEIQNVYIPIDDEGKPTGKYVRLPRDLDEKLVRYDAISSGRSTQWVVRSVNYQTSLEDQANRQGAQIQLIKARYELEVFSDDLKISMRFPEQAFSRLEGAVTVDQVPVAAERNQQEFTLSFPIRDKGTHALDLLFRPAVETTHSKSTAKLPLLLVPDSKLQLSTFLDLDQIDISSALGSVERMKQQAKILANLGPATELSIDWPSQERFNSQSSEIVQKTFMQVSAEEVDVECRIEFKNEIGLQRSYRLMADSQLELLSHGDQIVVDQSVVDATVGVKQFRFQPKAAVNGNFEAEFSFRYRETNGLGGIRFPKIKLADQPIDAQYIALSISGDLIANPISDDSFGIARIPVSRFAELWDSVGATKPDFSYEVVDDRYEAIFSSKPLESIGQLTSNSFYFLAREKCELTFVANVQQARKGKFQYEFSVDPELDVHEVYGLNNDESVRQLDWSLGDKRLQVFLGKSPEPALRIVVRGSWPTTESRFELPGINVPELDTHRVVISRQTSLTANILEANGYSRSISTIEGSTPPVSWPEHTVFVSTWTQEEPDGSLVVDVKPNQVDAEGRVFVIFDEDEDAVWKYQLDFHLKGKEHDIDFIRMGVPSEWQTPTLFGMEGSVDRGISPMGGTDFWTITPELPLEGNVQFRLEGEFDGTLFDAQSEVLPRVWLEQVPTLQKFICLPIPDDNWQWKVRGLRQRLEPVPDLPVNGTLETHQLYEVTQETYSIQRIQSQNQKVCTIERAIHHAWIDNDPIRGVSHYVIQAESNQSLKLSIPDATNIQQILLNGTPMDIPALAQHPEIRLPSSIQQQVVRVIWNRKAFTNSDATSQMVTAPQLYVVSAESDEQPIVMQTLWRIVECRPSIGSTLRIRPLNEVDSEFLQPRLSASEDMTDDFWGSTSHFRFSGNRNAIVIQADRSAENNNWLSIVVAASIFLVGIVASVNARGNRGEEFAPWVYPFGVLFGLGWWLFLQPSIIGWTIVAFCLMMSWLFR